MPSPDGAACSDEKRERRNIGQTPTEETLQGCSQIPWDDFSPPFVRRNVVNMTRNVPVTFLYFMVARHTRMKERPRRGRFFRRARLFRRRSAPAGARPGPDGLPGVLGPQIILVSSHFILVLG